MTCRSWLFLILSITPFTCYGLSYGLSAKTENPGKLTDLQIFSERCSGSNYVEALLMYNFFPEREMYASKFGHKHFPPWLELPIEQYYGPPRNYTYEDSDQTLFIVVFRDPYDWIRSFYLKPWYAHKDLLNLRFSKFIREKWRLDYTATDIIREFAFNEFVDKYTNGSYFENPMKLRAAKTENFLLIKNRVKNIYFLNYETIRDYPEEVIKEIGEIFGLKKISDFKNVQYYKDDPRQGKYNQKKYNQISQEDLNYINSQLDLELEVMLGYEIVQDANNLP